MATTATKRAFPGPPRAQMGRSALRKLKDLNSSQKTSALNA